jgi:selenoprotein W-related protein
LAGKLKSNFDIEVQLIEGAGGIFDVKLGGNLVYSKHETGSFPDEDELIASLREKIG